jgi:hypothetical protein
LLQMSSRSVDIFTKNFDAFWTKESVFTLLIWV